VIQTLSWEGYPDIHLTAKLLGMSVRTLQRHLAAAGVTHEVLVGRARFATAAALLQETNTKVLDIALDLGYSDHAHFTRAFRRWAGCSPQEYRRRQTGGCSSKPSGPEARGSGLRVAVAIAHVPAAARAIDPLRRASRCTGARWQDRRGAGV